MTGAAAKPLGPTCGANGGTKVHGGPCSSQLGLGELSGLCAVHDPQRAIEAKAQQEAMKRLGVTLPPAPQTIADAKDYASWAIDAVAKGPHAGGIDVKRAREIGCLLRQFQSSCHEAELAARIKTLETELRQFKAKAAAKTGGGGR